MNIGINFQPTKGATEIFLNKAPSLKLLDYAMMYVNQPGCSALVQFTQNNGELFNMRPLGVQHREDNLDVVDFWGATEALSAVVWGHFDYVNNTGSVMATTATVSNLDAPTNARSFAFKHGRTDLFTALAYFRDEQNPHRFYISKKRSMRIIGVNTIPGNPELYHVKAFMKGQVVYAILDMKHNKGFSVPK